MGWKFSIGISVALFLGGAIQGVAGNVSAMVGAFVACAGWAIAALEERDNSRLRKGLEAVEVLIDGSDGVTGLHLNGDIAPWDELRTGGRFDCWLADFDAALERPNVKLRGLARLFARGPSRTQG